MVLINKCNWIVIPKSDPSYEAVKDLLAIVEKKRTQKKQYDSNIRRWKTSSTSVNVVTYLYSIKNEALFVSYGLFEYIKHLFKDTKCQYLGIKDHPLLFTDILIKDLKKEIQMVQNEDKSGHYTNMLPGIKLYDYQLESLEAIFNNKRGMLHIPTGGGKTEIICATIQIMKEILGKYPTILVLEPTVELMKGIKKRFKKYKIPINDYRETRTIFSNKVNIAHPTSLGNDLEKNNKLLEKIEVQFADECHHFSGVTWRTPSYGMNNLIYSIGVSATSISHYHIDGSCIDHFSSEELFRIGACGPIIFKMEGEVLIENESLAYPKLAILNNPANEEINELVTDYIWTNVKKIRLESEKRTKLIAEAAVMMAKYDRKSIIMMNTLNWGRDIMKAIYDLGYGDIVRCCFGGQTYQKINMKNGKVEKEFNNVIEMFEKGKIKIIIGSSAIQEGIDLPHLDTCILAFGGKCDRTTLQSVGRALRTTKTGKYAYIVDFNDYEDRMLTGQFRERMIKYKKVLNIKKSEDIIKNCTIKEFEEKFKEWESL